MNNLISSVKTQAVEAFASAHSNFGWKVLLAGAVTVGDYLVGADNHSTMGMLAVLIGFDLCTAVMAAHKTGLVIESRKMLKTTVKLLVYAMMVSGAHLTESIVPGATFLDTTAISFLAITELISILENIGKMGYAIPNKLLNKLSEIRDR